MPEEAILKLFEVDRVLLEEEDVAFLIELFDALEEEPEMVRMFQGTIAFRFSIGADREVEPWDDAGVRNWGRAAYDQVPHLLYYLDPDPGLGALHLAMNLPDDNGEGKGSDLQRALGHPLVATANFARRMADPWEPIVQRFLDPLDPELATETVEAVAAALALEDGER